MSSDDLGRKPIFPEFQDIDKASEIMTKGLLSEWDSLKDVGITIPQEDVKKRILENANKGLTFDTEEQAKAYATLTLIKEGKKGNWSPIETDLFLDMFLDGAARATIGKATGRDYTKKAFDMKRWRLLANYRNQGYTPVSRKDRTGLPWSKREREIVREARDCVSEDKGDNRPHYLALILARPVQDVQDVWDRKGASKGFGI